MLTVIVVGLVVAVLAFILAVANMARGFSAVSSLETDKLASVSKLHLLCITLMAVGSATAGIGLLVWLIQLVNKHWG